MQTVKTQNFMTASVGAKSQLFRLMAGLGFLERYGGRVCQKDLFVAPSSKLVSVVPKGSVGRNAHLRIVQRDDRPLNLLLVPTAF